MKAIRDFLSDWLIMLGVKLGTNKNHRDWEELRDEGLIHDHEKHWPFREEC